MKMMRLIMCLIVISFVLSCGESKQNKSSRLELSKTIRQINVTYSDLKDNQKTEESLNLLKVRDYYSEYTKQFRQFRNELAGKPITPKFANISDQLDSILAKSTVYINARQKNMLGLFETSNSLSYYMDHIEDAISYKSKLHERTYRKYYYKCLDKAIDKSAEFEMNRRLLGETLAEQNSLVGELMIQSDSLNYLLRKLNFIDSLEFDNIITDTTNVIHSNWRIYNSISTDKLWDRIRDLSSFWSKKQ